jgi:NodT family efflux transporter outer membrane factor (OMF) lipoprotein
MPARHGGRTPRLGIRALPALTLVLLPAIAGCDLAPKYEPATMLLPDSYAGAGPFQRAHPQDTIPRGPWWEAFGNSTLNDLEPQIGKANPDLAAEVQVLLESRDLAAEAQSGLYPQIGTNFAPSLNKSSRQRLYLAPTSTSPIQEANVQFNVAASWELDLWDKIKNQAVSAKRQAQATQAAVAALDLSLQAELADDYIALRGLDQAIHVYNDTVASYTTAVGITKARLVDLIGSGIDEKRAENQLAAAQASLTDAQARRAVLVHAIATLVGVPASSFMLADQSETALNVGPIPTGVPSTLLQRRPDVAEAERQMAAANAQIGVARAAFYPDVNISALAGSTASSFDLFNLSESLWTIGSNITLPLFTGGLHEAQLQQAKAEYERTRDAYRSTVLQAVNQVEDGLSLTSLLTLETAQLAQSVQAARQVQDLSLSLYKVGTNSYLDVVVAQSAALSAEITRVNTETRALQASVDLIRALGGGWSTVQMASEHDQLPIDPAAPKPD